MSQGRQLAWECAQPTRLVSGHGGRKEQMPWDPTHCDVRHTEDSTLLNREAGQRRVVEGSVASGMVQAAVPGDTGQAIASLNVSFFFCKMGMVIPGWRETVSEYIRSLLPQDFP